MDIDGWPFVFAIIIGAVEYTFGWALEAFGVLNYALPAEATVTIEEFVGTGNEASADNALKLFFGRQRLYFLFNFVDGLLVSY